MASKKKTGGAPTRGYHHGDLRRALVREAISALVADQGADISLRSLARRLGVSHGAPAHHFADKAALLDAIASEGFRGLADALGGAAALPVSPKRKLAAAGVAYVEFALSHPAHVRTMFGRAGPHAPSDECARESMRAFDTLVSLARDAAGPKASAADVRVATFAAWAQVHGLSLLWLDGNAPLLGAAGGTADGLLALTADVVRMLSTAVSRLSRRHE